MAAARAALPYLNARFFPHSSPGTLAPSRKSMQFPSSRRGVAVSAAWIFPAAEIAADLIPKEPENALSLPTWAVHVSSVAEWAIAMVLVWKYGEKPGLESWKGLSWGMVPLLGGAFCACTWHFFYNAESLEILVALQAALTIIGNFTMCIAAYRIYRSTRPTSDKP